jgi:anthranilate phosphoribosyltransferase
VTPAVAEALRTVAARKPLPRPLAEEAFGDLMDGRATEAQKGALLLGIATRGETSDEIAGAVASLRRRMRRVATRRSPLLDTCGPGGLGRDLFNVSTAAAIVAAGAGAAVAKHGNRSISSRVGSADVLESSGVRLDLEPDAAGRVLDDVGLVFLFAPSFHPAMRELGTVRRELGIRTIFNALGPLANPAAAARQLIGVGRPELVPLLAGALAALGGERAIVFHSAAGLDELVPGASAEGLEVSEGATSPWRLDPDEVPQPAASVDALRGGDAADNAAMLARLLDGERGPRREAALLNAAVALVVEGRARGVREGYGLAVEALDSGEAGRRFQGLKEASRAA